MNRKAALVLALLVCLAGCIALPGTPMSDLNRMSDYASGKQMMSVDELRKLAAKPVPQSPMAIYEDNMLRRIEAEEYLGDVDATLRDYSELLRRHADPEFQQAALTSVLMTASESLHGQALREAIRQTEDVFRSRPPEHRNLRLLQWVAMVHGALEANDAQLAQHLLDDIPESQIRHPQDSPERRVWVTCLRPHFQARIDLAIGEPERTRIEESDGAKMCQSAMRAAGVTDDPVLQDHLSDMHAFQAIAAAFVGKLGEARQILSSEAGAKDRLAFLNGRLYVDFITSDTQAALADQRALAQAAPAGSYRSKKFAATNAAMTGDLLARSGQYDEAVRLVDGAIKDIGGASDMDVLVATRSMAAAMSSRPMQDLASLDRLDAKYYALGVGPVAIEHFEASALAHEHRGRDSTDLADLKKALEAGRAFSHMLRRARTNEREPTNREVFWGALAVESYARAALACRQRCGSNDDDILDALTLALWTPLDRNLRQAALRSSFGNEQGASELRELQDATHQAHLDDQELARVTDAVDATAQQRDAAKVVAQKSEARRSEAEKALTRVHPQWQQLSAETAPTVSDLRRRLGNSEALMMVVPISSTRTAQVVVDREHFIARLLDLGNDRLAADAARLVSALNTQGSDGANFPGDVSEELYRTLFEGAMTVDGKQTLLLTVRGPLATVPFSILSVPRSHARVPPAGQTGSADWLIRHVALLEEPSLDAWLAMPERALDRSRASVKAWFDPMTRRSSNGPSRLSPQDRHIIDELPQLPQTRTTASGLSMLMSEASGHILRSQENATRASVVAASHSGSLSGDGVLFFGTHGLSSGDLADLHEPALVMASAGDDPDGPLLTLSDVLGLRIDVDVVVLDACTTAGPDQKDGESYSGLSRGFLYAGASSVVVTRWEVTAGSAGVMIGHAFKEMMTRPGVSLAQAMRNAQLSMADGLAVPDQRTEWRNPFYWASFETVGVNVQTKTGASH